ncbi:hypothetical protein HY734_00775 [Candidatus Uhrbacteria bacterium]|nr:hypothetical protein [Candidatus Uhrbacteria bacterium]
MDGKFQRILSLVRRTGDRIIVTDPEGSDAYVLMSLEAYEVLMDIPAPMSSFPPGTEGKSDTADTDVPSPPPDQAMSSPVAPLAPSAPLPPFESKRIWDVMGGVQTSGQTWDPARLTDAERDAMAQTLEHLRGKEPDHPPISQPPKVEGGEGETGEEQFYLEPIE